jgi:hypothetical protein
VIERLALASNASPDQKEAGKKTRIIGNSQIQTKQKKQSALLQRGQTNMTEYHVPRRLDTEDGSLLAPPRQQPLKANSAQQSQRQLSNASNDGRNPPVLQATESFSDQVRRISSSSSSKATKNPSLQPSTVHNNPPAQPLQQHPHPFF